MDKELVEKYLLTRKEKLNVHKKKENKYGFPFDPDREFYTDFLKAQLIKAIPIIAQEIREELSELILADNMDAEDGVICYKDWQEFWERYGG